MTPIPRHIRTAPRHAPWRPASAGLQTMPLGNGAPYPVARRDSGHPEALFRARDRQPAATGTPKFSNSGRVPPSTVHEHGFRLIIYVVLGLNKEGRPIVWVRPIK